MGGEGYNPRIKGANQLLLEQTTKDAVMVGRQTLVRPEFGLLQLLCVIWRKNLRCSQPICLSKTKEDLMNSHMKCFAQD